MGIVCYKQNGYSNDNFDDKEFFENKDELESIPVGCVLPAFLVGGWADTPGKNMGPGSRTVSNIIPRGQTNTYENITLSQTSFAGCNKPFR